MGGGGGAPTFNAQQAANDQKQANVQTGIANATLTNTNQVTPYGNLTYSENGGRWVDGNWVPSYTATQTLSPEQQKIYDKTTGLQSSALDTAASLLPKVQGAINTPLTDNTALRDQAYKALTARSNEDIGRAEEGQRVQLANQGIQAGSEAYTRAMDQFNRARTDASNQATINTGNVAAQNLGMEQTIRNQPLADYATLLGFGGGVTSPSYAQGVNANIPATDTMTPAMQAYQGQMQAWQQGQQNNNALMGGLFGLAGAGLGGFARNGFSFGGRG